MKPRPKPNLGVRPILWIVGSCAVIAAAAGLLVGVGGRSSDGAGWEGGLLVGVVAFVVLLALVYFPTRAKDRQ